MSAPSQPAAPLTREERVESLAGSTSPAGLARLASKLAPIRTLSGRYLDLLNPEPDDLLLDDIACGLGKECRFGNQIRRHYSVAEHSIRLAHAAANMMYPAEVQLGLMLHDAPEAYMGDCPRPLKVRLRGYDLVEEPLMLAIWRKFGQSIFPAVEWESIRHDVAALDQSILHVERVELVGHDGVEWAGERNAIPIGRYCPPIRCLDYDAAELAWRREYTILSCVELRA